MFVRLESTAYQSLWSLAVHRAAPACLCVGGWGSRVLLTDDLKMAALGELSHFLSWAKLS